MSEEFDKSTILESFLDEVNAYLPEIEANLDRLQQDPGNTEALEETYRRTHTIGGSAAMMDFSGLARVAQGMEEQLGDALDQGIPLSGSTVALLRRSQGRLTRLIEAVRTGADDAPIVADDDADRSASRSSSFGSSSVAISTPRPLTGMPLAPACTAAWPTAQMARRDARGATARLAGGIRRTRGAAARRDLTARSHAMPWATQTRGNGPAAV